LDDISKERDEALRARAMTALGRLVLFCLRHAREPEALVTALSRWLDLVREISAAPGGPEALARIWRYIFVVSSPAEPVDLVKRLVGVVGKESEETVMNVAEWLEQKGEQRGQREGIRKTLLKVLRSRFGEVPPQAMARIQEADDRHLDLWTDRVITAPTLDDVLTEA
jgi:type VI protein secretion system component VasF